MWKNIVVRGRPQMTIWRMRIACWISMATDTNSEYVIHIVFPLHEWLHEPTLMLRCMHFACLVAYVCDSLALAGAWVYLAVGRMSEIRI